MPKQQQTPLEQFNALISAKSKANVSAPPRNKRTMNACIPGLSIPEERELKAELRELGERAINDPSVRLSNGMRAWTFARDYVIALRQNRQLKARESKLKRQQRVRTG